jgi:hypothetical protein
VTFVPTPSTCALHGDAGCFRRFQHATPKYVYEKKKLRNDAGVTVTIPWCQCVYPKPQIVTDAKCAHCPEWRDRACRDAETVRKLMATGEYRDAD